MGGRDRTHLNGWAIEWMAHLGGLGAALGSVEWERPVGMLSMELSPRLTLHSRGTGFVARLAGTWRKIYTQTHLRGREWREQNAPSQESSQMMDSLFFKIANAIISPSTCPRPRIRRCRQLELIMESWLLTGIIPECNLSLLPLRVRWSPLSTETEKPVSLPGPFANDQRQRLPST